MSNIYFASDLHFGHNSAMKFCPCFRNYASVDEMDEAIINAWNKQVSPNDTVYNLGDVTFYMDLSKIVLILERLNGKHILVLGNHDQVIKKNQDKLLTRKKLNGNALFDEICEYKDIAIKIDEKAYQLILFNYPMMEWNRGHFGSFLLYGYLHKKIANIKGRALNVGYDLHGNILSIGEICELLKDIEPYEHSKDDVFYPNDSVDERVKKIRKILKLINS